MAKTTDWSGPANTATGAIIGLALGGHQVNQQRKLQEVQIKGQKEMADYNVEKQMDMWNRTNYGAQKEHMKNAGINPGLMYGMGGGGGATAASAPGNVTGATAEQPNQTASAAVNMGLMLAQKRVLETQADKNEAEAAATAGVKTDNIKAQTANVNVDTEIKKIQQEVQGKSIESQIDAIHNGALKLFGEMTSALRAGQLSDVTFNEQVNQVKQKSTLATIEVALAKSNIAVNTAKVEEITNNIMQRWQELSISETRTRYEHEDRLTAIREYTVNALKVAGIHAAGNIAGDIVKVVTRQPIKGGKNVPIPNTN